MPLWTPSQIATQLWLDASDSSTLYNATSGGSLVAADGAIARWQDKSGNARHVTQSTLANRPLRKTSVLNGLDVVRFDGVDDLLETTFSSFGSSHYSIAIVRAVNFTSAIGGIFVCRSKTLANPINPQISFNNGISQYAIRDDAGSVNSNPISGLVNNTWYSFGGLRNGSNTTTYRNGVPGVTGTNVIGTATTGVTSVGALYSGGSTPNSWVNGDIAELIVVPASSRLEAEGYIHWKWGLQSSLPISHPYYSAAPTIPTGIGGEVGWWCPSLDTIGNGTTLLRDLTGSGNNGTLTNMDAATDWVADTGNSGVRALDFDGLNDRVQASSAFPSFTSDIFVCAWIKQSAPKDDSGIVVTRNVLTGASRNGFALYARDSVANNISFEVVHSGTRHTAKLSTTLTNGVWYFAYGFRNGTTGDIKVGVSGIGEATAPTTSTATVTHEVTPTIGGFRDWNHFQGRIDGVRVFNKILTTDEISALASRRAFQSVVSRRRRLVGGYGL